MKITILYASICLFLTSTTYAFKLTGDTLGSAERNLTELRYNLEYILSPGKLLGKIDLTENNRLSKAVCAQLGSAVSYANATSNEIALYSSENSKINQDFISQINALKQTLADGRNEYCFGKVDDLGRAEAAVIKAQKMVLEISATLDVITGANTK